MHSTKRRIAITGATGFLGRNLLFEVIKQNLADLNAVEVLLLGRSNRCEVALVERVRGILNSDEFEPLGLSRQSREFLLSRVIQCIEIDLEASHVDSAALKSAPIDWFFHVAGLTDLRISPAAEVALQRVNVEATRRVLQLVSQLRIGEFCYVGTAYSCGNAAGHISPDRMDASHGFRNPYERSKYDAELLVREFAQKTGTRCRYFRPSTICGRLMEAPWGAVSKFDVLYSWPAFFLRMRRKQEPHFREGKARICFKADGGLNIVPVDYVAKMMYLVCDQNDPGSSFHLVNEFDTPHEMYTAQMLEAVGVTGVTAVESIPADLNPLEELYYRSVGAVYTPYVTSLPMTFCTGNLRPLMERSGLSCPPVNRAALDVLMAYAIEKDFGLSSLRKEAAGVGR